MKEIVILDLDGVIIKGQSQQFFLDYLFQEKIIGLFFYLRIYVWFVFYKLGLVRSPKKIITFAFLSNLFHNILYTNEYFIKV